MDHVVDGIGEFSSAIGDLLDAAATTSLDEFPEALLRVLHRRLEFDGAVVGHADPLSDGPFSIAVAHVHQREPSILDEYKLVSAGDPVTQAFLAGLLQPLAVDTEALYSDSAHAPMLGFSRRHRLRHLLLCGYPPNDQRRGRWIVLYRSHDQPFGPDSVRWLGAFCLHLDRALDINRQSDGFNGRCITGKFTPMGSHHICELREVGPVGLLTPREGQVAQLFAQGSNSREISAALSVSMSTVHSHIASAYLKLGISDKASLVRIFSDSGA